ncbi:hypothetical protein PGT21_021559 [Puccinia graminis f. sp. tritici]|uniref:Uncharacterized protein n=1 Tax=Puccinia graminis f. sp. tritici TaxID=56615 RepID=A0A5B0MRT4_PUCGR|nr:hypothetical protein PGT21_021559 [Puccinia graminis f. sp. tritici]
MLRYKSFKASKARPFTSTSMVCRRVTKRPDDGRFSNAEDFKFSFSTTFRASYGGFESNLTDIGGFKGWQCFLGLFPCCRVLICC